MRLGTQTRLRSNDRRPCHQQPLHSGDEQLGRFQRYSGAVYGKLDGLGFAQPMEKGVEWLRPRPSFFARRSSQKSIAPSRSPLPAACTPLPRRLSASSISTSTTLSVSIAGLRETFTNLLPGTSCLSISERARVVLGASSGHASSRPFRRSGPRCASSSTMATNGCFSSSSSAENRRRRRSDSLGCCWRPAKRLPNIRIPRTGSALGGNRRRLSFQAATSAGRLPRNGDAFSKASATRNRVGSWNGLPTSWIATGSPPAPKPAQIEIAG